MIRYITDTKMNNNNNNNNSFRFNQCVAITPVTNTRCAMKAYSNQEYCEMHCNRINEGCYVRRYDEFKIETKDEIKIVNDVELPVILDEPIPIILEDSNKCECCFQFYPPEEMVSCSKSNSKFNHITCCDCLKDYLESVLGQNKSVGCMMDTGKDGCKGRYLDEDVKRVLSNESYVQYIEGFNVEETIQFASILTDYHMCPFCSQYGVIVENIDEMRELSIKCGRCLKSWCPRCRGVSHVPEPCGKLITEDVELIRRVIDNTIDEAFIHKCPKCFLKFNKEEGCNYVVCSTCKIGICYLCCTTIPDDENKYEHFRIGKCSLYNHKGATDQETVRKSNLEFKDKCIINALTELLTANTHDRRIFLILCKEVAKKGYSVDIGYEKNKGFEPVAYGETYGSERIIMNKVTKITVDIAKPQPKVQPKVQPQVQPQLKTQPKTLPQVKPKVQSNQNVLDQIIQFCKGTPPPVQQQNNQPNQNRQPPNQNIPINRPEAGPLPCVIF